MESVTLITAPTLKDKCQRYNKTFGIFILFLDSAMMDHAYEAIEGGGGGGRGEGGHKNVLAWEPLEARAGTGSDAGNEPKVK